MSAPRLYMLCGLPFAGKSTLARALAAETGWALVELDAINTESGVGLHGEPITPERWTRSYREAYRRVGRALASGRTVLFDATSATRDQRDRLRALAARHGAGASVIYVDVGEAVARLRWLANRASGGRADVRDEDFAQVAARLEPPSEDESTLRYDGSEPPRAWIARHFGGSDATLAAR
jgi:predicted kinase